MICCLLLVGMKYFSPVFKQQSIILGGDFNISNWSHHCTIDKQTLKKTEAVIQRHR